MSYPDPDFTVLAGLVTGRLDRRGPLPTLGEYLPRVVAATGPGARKAYGSYWNHILVAWDTRDWMRSPPPRSRNSPGASPPTRGSDAPAAVAGPRAST